MDGDDIFFKHKMADSNVNFLTDFTMCSLGCCYPLLWEPSSGGDLDGEVGRG